MNTRNNLGINATGRCRIFDVTETENLSEAPLILDKTNAIHPQNMARVVARALSRESNSWIHRIAFGNGGTIVDAAYTITYRTPNDGQIPDTAGWESRLYNETYSEIVDDSNVNVTIGEGSQPGDPESIEHLGGPGVRSSEAGLTSDVVVEAILNQNEPTGQFDSDNLTGEQATNSVFTFDELGLYTTGLSSTAVAGYQDVDVGNVVFTDSTGLALGQQYQFNMTVDGGSTTVVTFTTRANGSGTGGVHTYGDLVDDLTPFLPSGSTVEVTNEILGTQTYGFLRFISGTAGQGSTVDVNNNLNGPALSLFNNLTGFNGINNAVPGANAGVQNDPVNPENERERLLTHLIFSPITKTANRRYKIQYTITVRVARSINPDV